MHISIFHYVAQTSDQLQIARPLLFLQVLTKHQLSWKRKYRCIRCTSNTRNFKRKISRFAFVLFGIAQIFPPLHFWSIIPLSVANNISLTLSSRELQHKMGRFHVSIFFWKKMAKFTPQHLTGLKRTSYWSFLRDKGQKWDFYPIGGE